MQNAPLRSEIEKALDEIERYEEGMRFQSLAVVLAKQRWPELVATERKNDLGLDAYVTSEQATDHVGRGLACSITPEYSKIASDAKRVAEHFTGQIQRLIFATSGKVATPKKIEWVKRVREKFDFELEVISREDIVTSLTAPQNVGLCRTYLRLDVEVDQSVASLVQKIREAASEEVTNWARRVAGHPRIALQAIGIEANGADGDTIWSLADVEAGLRDARRIMIEAPAGRGKTTTLIQLAQGGLSTNGTVFFIDLPSWMQSGARILDFIAGMPAFKRRSLTSQQLAQCESAERFYFLLNGWNEVTESLSRNAAVVMRELEREFPSAGILVATRAHHISPLPGATRIRLRRISPRTRTKYVRERLGERARELLTTIEGDQALDELTRVPFVLAHIAGFVEAGEQIPRTRVSVMDAVIRLQERSAEHEAHLGSAPLWGMAESYLEGLAMEMILRGSVSLSDAEARETAHRMSAALTASGQITTAPSPLDILNVLCAHHVLERLEYPVVAYRFEHQLFQEYYASRGLERTFPDSDTGANERGDFVRRYVNEPAWSEPLTMFAETLCGEVLPTSSSDQRSTVPSDLVDMALGVDLIFAAHLYSVLRVPTDERMAKTLNRKLRDWYASSDVHHQECAVAAMLASGLDAFRDIIEPRLSNDDQQMRLRTYRLWPDLRVSILGSDWQRIVGTWSEEARKDFVAEILHHRFVPEVSSFALADPSKRVKQSAMEALIWIGADEESTRGADSIDDDDLVRLILATSPDSVPQALHARARSALERYHSKETVTVDRMRVLLALHQLEDPIAPQQLKLDLDGLPSDSIVNLSNSLIGPILEAVHANDPRWTSEWVARRIATDTLWSDRWGGYVTEVPTDLREDQFHRLATENLEHKRLESSVFIVAKNAGPDIARRAFLRLLEVQKAIESESPGRATVEWEIYRQIETLLRAISPSVVVAGLSDILAHDPDRLVVDALVHLYGRTGTAEAYNSDLDEPSRELVRAYIRRSVGVVRAEQDFSGELKATFTSVLSQVGEPSDIGDVLSSVDADIERMRVGRAARVAGERSDQADYSTTSQTHSYVRSIVTLLGGDADSVLLNLLEQPEYETAVLEQFGRQFDALPRRELGRRRPYEQIWEARAGKGLNHVDAGRRARVAKAIRSRMMQLEGMRGEETHPQQLNGRLKKLALGLAQTDPRGYADLILDTLMLEVDFDAYLRVDAAECLLFSGAALPADKCLPLLDSALERMKQWGMQDHERWVLIRFLCICPYVAPQTAGIMKIRQVIEQARLHSYDFRELLPALGHSRFDGALEIMRALVPAVHEWRMLESEWISALTMLDTEDARRTILGLVDRDLPSLPFVLDVITASDQAAPRIAQLAKSDPAVDARLRALTLLSLEEPKRNLLAKALAVRGTPEAMLAVLNLIDDAAHPRIPWEVGRFLENTFVEHQPYRGYQNMFTLKGAASNPLRTRLFEMVFNDERRKHSAYSLLGQIEEWRLEYGRPVDEPRHPAIESGLAWPSPEPR